MGECMSFPAAHGLTITILTNLKSALKPEKKLKRTGYARVREQYCGEPAIIDLEGLECHAEKDYIACKAPGATPEQKAEWDGMVKELEERTNEQT